MHIDKKPKAPLAELGESDRRFREMLESLELVSIAVDRNGVVTFCNAFLLRLTGWTRAEVIGQRWFDRFLPDSAAAMKQVFLGIIESGKIVPHYQYPIKTRTGELREIAWTNTMLRDGGGNIVGTASIGADVTERSREEAALRTAKRQLHTLIARLHTAQEDEARRIARELHDDLGQQLTALNLKLGNLELNLPGGTPHQREQFARMHRIVNHTIETVQKISGELRLGQLDLLGLTAAIDWQLKEFSRRSGIACLSPRLDEVANLSDAQSTVVFRILQEALTNVVRHAGATAVDVSLEAAPEELTLTIRDNGRGITAAELSDHQAIGLLGMRERAQLVGGDVAIAGGAGRGTTVVVRIPLGQSGQIPA
jgi:PAS domain S-box-containing protein